MRGDEALIPMAIAVIIFLACLKLIGPLRKGERSIYRLLLCYILCFFTAYYVFIVIEYELLPFIESEVQAGNFEGFLRDNKDVSIPVLSFYIRYFPVLVAILFWLSLKAAVSERRIGPIDIW